MFRVSTTYRFAHSLQISIMAFLIAFARCVTNGDGASNSAIHRYVPNTSSVDIQVVGSSSILITPTLVSFRELLCYIKGL